MDRDDLHLQSATISDLAFAQALTRANMRIYCDQYGLTWQPEAFDAEWSIRTNYLVCRDEQIVGYLGLNVESRYLYLRDLQLKETWRGRGIGGWAIERVVAIAHAGGCSSVRLKVFKSNPAVALYRRLNFEVVKDEPALFCMERIIIPA